MASTCANAKKTPPPNSVNLRTGGNDIRPYAMPHTGRKLQQMTDTQHGLKARTIKSILRRKMDDLLASIDDESVRNTMAQHAIITGGSIASMLLGEKVNDYDIYLDSKNAVVDIATYYVEKFKENPPPRMRVTGEDIPITVEVDDARTEIYMGHERAVDGTWREVERTRTIQPRVRIKVKSAGVASEEGDASSYEYFEAEHDPDAPDTTAYVERAFSVVEDAAPAPDRPPYRPVFLSSNAITLSDNVQIVIRFYGDPDTVHQSFDFEHCKSYWVAHTNDLVLPPSTMECLLARELRYGGSFYPLASIIRTRKFIKRGWSINAGQYLRMAMQVSKLDLENISVLEDQLVGVDTAYFNQIVNMLKAKFPDGKCPQAYLFALIDRMF